MNHQTQCRQSCTGTFGHFEEYLFCFYNSLRNCGHHFRLKKSCKQAQRIHTVFTLASPPCSHPTHLQHAPVHTHVHLWTHKHLFSKPLKSKLHSCFPFTTNCVVSIFSLKPGTPWHELRTMIRIRKLTWILY